MSGSIIFLGIALGVSLLGGFTLWLFSRERRSYDSSIRDFQQNMGALKPPTDRERRSRRGP